MEQWFYNQFHTIFEQHAHLQPTPARRGQPGLPFERLDVELENGVLTVRLALDSTCRIPPERADVLNAVRAAFNAGTLGEGVVAVNAPGEASLAQQSRGEAMPQRSSAKAVAARSQKKAAADRAALQQAEADAANEFLGRRASPTPSASRPRRPKRRCRPSSKKCMAKKNPSSWSTSPCGMSNTPTAPCVHSTAPRASS